MRRMRNLFLKHNSRQPSLHRKNENRWAKPLFFFKKKKYMSKKKCIFAKLKP